MKPYLIHDVVVMQLNNRRRGTASDEDPGRGSGRRQETVAAEGDRQGQGRKHDVSRVGRRRNRVRAETEGVPYVSAQEGEEGRPQVCPYRAQSGRAPVRCSTSSSFASISTKSFAGIMKTLNLSKPLVVVQGKDEVLEKSARNIPYTKVLRTEGLNVYDVMRHEQLMVTVDALKKIEEALSS